jgi:hypothetical protein
MIDKTVNKMISVMVLRKFHDLPRACVFSSSTIKVQKVTTGVGNKMI